MPQTEIRIRTKVLSGKRVEVTSPELTEGDEIEVVLHAKEPSNVEKPTESQEEKAGIWDYIQSLPPSNLTMEDWAEIERDFQEGRDSWDD